MVDKYLIVKVAVVSGCICMVLKDSAPDISATEAHTVVTVDHVTTAPPMLSSVLDCCWNTILSRIVPMLDI